LFRARGTRAYADGLYLSELPGRINVAEDGVVRPEADPLVHRALSPWASSRSSGDRPHYAGWGGAQADASPYGQALQVAGGVFRSGIGILANSRLEVKTEGAARFAASVGVDDWTRNPDTRVRFQVYGDGRLLTETGFRRASEAAVPIRADIKGVTLVELVVRTEKPETVPPSVVWGDAALLSR
jgi:hypothetical protein